MAGAAPPAAGAASGAGSPATPSGPGLVGEYVRIVATTAAFSDLKPTHVGKVVSANTEGTVFKVKVRACVVLRALPVLWSPSSCVGGQEGSAVVVT